MKIKKLILMILVAFLLVTLLNQPMAKKGDTVAVDYWLTADGKQIDTSEGRGVFEFTLGNGDVIPGFDKAVEGMKVGEEKTVVLTGNDAYTQGPLAGKDLTFKIILREIK
jgi:peptidylprolyl isomerase